MGNQASGSRTDTVVKLVLIFFIALLSFSVGTFVGKQVSDSDHRAASLENDYQSFRDIASVDQHGNKVQKPHTVIDSEEVNSLTDEFINAEKAHDDHGKAKEDSQPKETHKTDHNTHAEETVAKANHEKKSDHVTTDGYKKYNRDQHKPDDEHKEASAHQPSHDKKVPIHQEKIHKAPASAHSKPTAQHKKPVSHKEPISHAAARVAKGHAPSKTIKKRRLPSSVLPSVATSAIGKYTVQVASYANETEAKTHAANLKWKGFSAFYIPAKIKGKTWYRVSIGLFANQKRAATAKVDFLKRSGAKTAIIQKILK